MMRLLVLGLGLCVACGSDETPKTEPEPTERPEPEPEHEPEPERAAEFDASGEREAAAEAYRAFTKAYNEGERDAYFGAMGDALECFYGRRNVPKEEIERRRWRDDRGLVVVGRLDALRQSAGEIVFRDRGVWLREAGGRQVIHEKFVVMRHDGTWKVVAETNREEMQCLGELDAGVVSAELTACRGAHTSCLSACDANDCRNDCLTAAMRCVGVGNPPSPPNERASIKNAEAARRFVAWSLLDYGFTFGGGATPGYPELEDEMQRDERWLSAARARARALTARRSRPGVADASCGVWPVGYAVMEERGFPSFWVDEARCDGNRCVVPLRETDTAHYVLHLVFDGDDLRVMELHGPQPTAFDMEAEIARYASEKPASWDTECQPPVVALANDRVGRDFFSVDCWLDPGEEGQPPNDYVITRLCGADAQRAVAGLGDEWSCNDTRCSPVFMCGNGCEDLAFDGDRVLSHASGMSPTMAVTAEIAERIRPMIRCGETKGFGYEWLRGEED